MERNIDLTCEKFYMLWAEEKGCPPFKHRTLELAIKEATRLSAKYKFKINILLVAGEVEVTCDNKELQDKMMIFTKTGIKIDYNKIEHDRAKEEAV